MSNPIPASIGAVRALAAEQPPSEVPRLSLEVMGMIRNRLIRVHPYCGYCGRRVGRNTATLDHAIPVSRGGTDDLSNLVLACRPCNEAKADRTPREYALTILRNVRRLAR